MSGRSVRKAAIQLLQAEAAPPAVAARILRRGWLDLGTNRLEVVLLDDGRRMLTDDACVLALTGSSDEQLAQIVGIPALSSRLGPKVISEEDLLVIDPELPSWSGSVHSFDFLYRLMCVYAEANEDRRTPLTVKQRQRGFRCRPLIDLLDVVDVENLLDEAVGRHSPVVDKMDSVVNGRKRLLPDEFWKELGRLTGRPEDRRGTPQWWGKLVNWLIYDTLDPAVVQRIDILRLEHGAGWHMIVPHDPDLKLFLDRSAQVTLLAQGCFDLDDLRSRVAEIYGSGIHQGAFLDLLSAPCLGSPFKKGKNARTTAKSVQGSETQDSNLMFPGF